jgi:hypothetical protein
MINFPLYDTLIKNIKTKRDLSKKQKNKFINDLKLLNDKGIELIYLLIRIYHINNDNKNMTEYSLPYSGIYDDNQDIIFDLEKFPINLKRILFDFQEIHLKTMKEEETRCEY